MLKLLHIQSSTFKLVFNWKSWEFYFSPKTILWAIKSCSSLHSFLLSKLWLEEYVIIAITVTVISNVQDVKYGFQSWQKEVCETVFYTPVHSTDLFHITTVWGYVLYFYNHFEIRPGDIMLFAEGHPANKWRTQGFTLKVVGIFRITALSNNEVQLLILAIRSFFLYSGGTRITKY